MKPFKHEALYVFKEDAGEWQAALQIFWEIKMLQSGELSSTHCFDILNRVFVKAGQWQLSLQLMNCMEKENFIPMVCHVASTCRVIMENQPPLAPELLRTALKQWKDLCDSPMRYVCGHCNLPRILQRAGCNLSIFSLANRYSSHCKTSRSDQRIHLGTFKRSSELDRSSSCFFYFSFKT